MNDDSFQNISVVLAGRTYPVLVKPDEVSRVQAINQRLTQELSDLQSRYSNQLNNQDLLAMLLLTYANRLEEEQLKNDLSPVQERVEAIEQLLEQVFDQ
jgi:cell division protein ZapA (FtsZ GTPase activity inhibitor)